MVARSIASDAVRTQAGEGSGRRDAAGRRQWWCLDRREPGAEQVGAGLPGMVERLYRVTIRQTGQAPTKSADQPIPDVGGGG